MDDLTVAALLVGFLGAALVVVIVIALTNSRWWHERCHVRRGVRRFTSCDHCTRDEFGAR